MGQKIAYMEPACHKIFGPGNKIVLVGAISGIGTTCWYYAYVLLLSRLPT